MASGAGDNGLRSEDIEREGQARPPDLGGIPESPERAPDRPAEFQPVRMGDKRLVNFVDRAGPGLVWKEAVNLTPVVIDRGTRKATSSDYLVGDPAVGDPLVDTMVTPGITHVLGPAPNLGPAWSLGAVPRPHLIIGLDDPQVGGTSRNGRLKTQARREPAVSGWLGQGDQSSLFSCLGPAASGAMDLTMRSRSLIESNSTTILPFRWPIWTFTLVSNTSESRSER